MSNSHPENRDYLTLALSTDGMIFDRLFFLVEGEFNAVDYPMVMEHDEYLYIAHSGGVGGRKQSVEAERVSVKELERMEMGSE